MGHKDFALVPEPRFFFQAKSLSLQIYPVRNLISFQKHKFTVFAILFRQ